MTPETIAHAARQLAEARIKRLPLAELDAHVAPQSAADIHAIQDATVSLLGEHVAGWKVTTSPAGEVVRGAILGSRVFASPASIDGALVPMRAVELEIAFRFERALPPRALDYTYDEVADAVSAFVAFEIVDSRFTSYADAPWLHRAADCVSNGAFVAGDARADWRKFDLATLEARLSVGNEVLVERIGGHASGDPLLPAIALVNAFRRDAGVPAGRFVTTGTYTGLQRIDSGASVTGSFTGFGTVSLTFL